MGGGAVSDRLFVEGQVGPDPARASYVLMRDLDDEARQRGYHVAGDVTISTYEHGLLGPMMRLEADARPGRRNDTR